jgi:hypothetical protein
VLSPDGYAILPMRPITTARTVAIVMAQKLASNRRSVKTHGAGTGAPRANARSIFWAETF